MYLSGCVRDDLPPGVGVMVTPHMGNQLPDDRIWAADTGSFAAPERFEAVAYLRWLAARQPVARRCLFATAPDTWGDSAETLRKSLPLLPLIRALGYRAALVAQDGLTPDAVPWEEIDCLFTGGTDPWRASEAPFALVAAARARGKWCHLGRVNSYRRLRLAQVSGYDSADGTYLAFGPAKNLPTLSRWVTALTLQPTLFHAETP